MLAFSIGTHFRESQSLETFSLALHLIVVPAPMRHSD